MGMISKLTRKSLVWRRSRILCSKIKDEIENYSDSDNDAGLEQQEVNENQMADDEDFCTCHESLKFGACRHDFPGIVF